MRAAILAGCLGPVIVSCVGRAEGGSNAGNSAWLNSDSAAAAAAPLQAVLGHGSIAVTER